MTNIPQDDGGNIGEDPASAFTWDGTLGVEEELYLVDGSFRPTGEVESFLQRIAGQQAVCERFDHETYNCILETETHVCNGVGDVRRDLEATRESLVGLAGQYGYGIAAAGLHPTLRWQEHDCVDTDHYRELLDRFKYPQWRNTTTGMHVHVGVDDADKAVWVANELRWYMPVVLALSANSPYYAGTDTGLQSARAKIFGNVPHTGNPPAFDSYEDFLSFVQSMTATGAATDSSELWYDVRPHLEHGTVEVRAPDAQADIDRVLALVEYVAALVEDLCARYEDGEPGLDCRRQFLAENRWRAIRNGHEAAFIRPDGDGVVDIDTLVQHECDRLDVRGIRRLLDGESGARVQRRIWQEAGPDAVCQALCIDPGTRYDEQPLTSESVVPAQPAPRSGQ